MKKTMYLTMLAAAVTGTQVLADTVRTGVEGNYEYVEAAGYVGSYSQSGDATGGNITVVSDAAGKDLSGYTVCGGYTPAGAANGNSANMTGGQVLELNGGYTIDYLGSAAQHNTAAVSGGTVETVRGGFAFYGDATDNVVVISGGEVTEDVYGGYALMSNAANNSVHLVGAGATATIDDILYVGQGGIVLGDVYGGDSLMGSVSGNSVDLYGYGITANSLQGMDSLNFHLALADSAMLTLTAALDLSSGTDLSFSLLQGAELTAGDSVTLLESGDSITLSADRKAATWDIYAGSRVAAKGTLTVDGGKTLKMTITEVVPEPTAATLSLLALAGLAARRRRK